MLQNKLKSDVARFTTHVQTCQQPVLVQEIFDESRKTRNNVAKQVACFLLPVFRTLSVADTKGYLVQCKQICDPPL